MRFPLLLAALLVAGVPLSAQTRADSASIVLDAARALRREGRDAAARDLLRLIRARYAATPAARTADSLLLTLTGIPATSGTGRTGYILFHTLYGGFLGVAIPAALGADGSEPYGVGLLVGAPLGYFGSRAFARSKITMPGQAGLAAFVTAWGTWQGLALQQVLNIGEGETCNEFGCFRDDSDTAPWAAMAVGGLAGIGVGHAIASRPVPAGTSTMVSHSAWWGTWFGLALGRVFDVQDDDNFAAMLLGGNAALLLALPAAKTWRPSPAQVRITSAAGLAGGLVGFGIDLLASTDDESLIFGIPAATSALGLIVGALATRNQRDPDEVPSENLALVTVRGGIRVNAPLPLPAVIPAGGPQRPRWVPGFRIALLDGTF
jgi:hypothetical protein